MRNHKPSGKAVVTIRLADGSRRDVYLGVWRSAEAKREYNRLIAELAAAGGALPSPDPAVTTDLTITELIAAFKRHAEVYYRRPDGSASRELEDYPHSLRPLRELYGHTRARDFGPLALKATRERMIAAGLARSVVNQRIGRVKRFFRWAASEQLIPFLTYQSITTVAGLRRGAARETEPVKPVAEADVRAVLPFVLSPVAGMIEVQLLTGMRPGEVCRMRPADIDPSGTAWVYRPTAHKSDWRGKTRAVPLGPKARAVLDRFDTPTPTDYYFSPARAVAELQAARRANRKTSVQPSQVNRAKRKPKKQPGAHYDPRSYAQAIAKGCRKAGVVHWHPNQLRHLRGTEVRRVYGIEAAQVLLGHSRADVTQVYAQRDEQLAAKVAAEVG